LTGETLKETRNILIESARIARGNVKDIKELDSQNYDAVLFPGGFGAAKNLSNFATTGSECTVDPDVERVIKSFHENLKPIGVACISPILVAKVLGKANKGPGVSVTLGKEGEEWPYAKTIENLEKWGSNHVKRAVAQVAIDKKNSIYSVPAFMYETQNFSKIYDSIYNLVESMKDGIKPKMKSLSPLEEDEKKDKKKNKTKKEEPSNASDSN